MRFAKALRKAIGGLSQGDVAELVGVHQTTVGRWMRGDGEPNLRQLEALERAFPALRNLRAA